jgi:hypothetical protein
MEYNENLEDHQQMITDLKKKRIKTEESYIGWIREHQDRGHKRDEAILRLQKQDVEDE